MFDNRKHETAVRCLFIVVPLFSVDITMELPRKQEH